MLLMKSAVDRAARPVKASSCGARTAAPTMSVTAMVSAAAGRVADPTGIELPDTQTRSGLNLADEKAGDQISRQDEKDIDANESPGTAGDAAVERDHDQYRDASQSVDIRPKR